MILQNLGGWAMGHKTFRAQKRQVVCLSGQGEIVGGEDHQLPSPGQGARHLDQAMLVRRVLPQRGLVE